MQVMRLSYSGAKQTKCKVLVSLYNGIYADEGILSISFYLDDANSYSKKTQSEQLRY